MRPVIDQQGARTSDGEDEAQGYAIAGADRGGSRVELPAERIVVVDPRQEMTRRLAPRPPRPRRLRFAIAGVVSVPAVALAVWLAAVAVRPRHPTPPPPSAAPTAPAAMLPTQAPSAIQSAKAPQDPPPATAASSHGAADGGPVLQAPAAPSASAVTPHEPPTAQRLPPWPAHRPSASASGGAYGRRLRPTAPSAPCRDPPAPTPQATPAPSPDLPPPRPPPSSRAVESTPPF